MKKILSVLLIIIMLMPITVNASNSNIKVFINGNELKMDAPPIIVNYDLYQSV